MKKSKWIYLVFFFVIGILAVQSVWGEGQIQKRKVFIQKPKPVRVARWIFLYQGQNQIGGNVEITRNGNPLSKWKVTAGGHSMNFSGSYYKLNKKSFSVRPGKLGVVKMTPPPGFWPRDPRLPSTSGTIISSPIIATAKVCRFSTISYPANRARIRLGGSFGNLKVTWIEKNLGTHSFTLYEVVSRGNFKQIFRKGGGGGGVASPMLVPKRLLKPNKAYKITITQFCKGFKFNGKVAPGSYLDLHISIDSYFYTL